MGETVPVSVKKGDKPVTMATEEVTEYSVHGTTNVVSPPNFEATTPGGGASKLLDHTPFKPDRTANYHSLSLAEPKTLRPGDNVGASGVALSPPWEYDSTTKPLQMRGTP